MEKLNPPVTQHINWPIRKRTLTLAGSRLFLVNLLFSSAVMALNYNSTEGDCSPIITGDVKAPIKIECKGSVVPASAFAKLELYLQENYRSQKNLNDLIDKLHEDVSEWEEKYKDALSQNIIDRDKHPDDPLLEAERIALESGELEQAAEIREAYFERLEQQTAQAAYITGERWETAFRMEKALKFIGRRCSISRTIWWLGGILAGFQNDWGTTGLQ